MSFEPQSERRKHPREKIEAPLRFYHATVEREFPARCIDVSGGGIGVAIPPTTPVKPGQNVRVLRASGKDVSSLFLADDTIEATVARVDRGGLTTSGQLVVGLAFKN